jgi:hypothetical protein
MKLQIIRKENKYSIRQKFLFFWLYYNNTADLGWRCWSSSAEWLSYNEANRIYKETIHTHQKSKTFSKSKIMVIENIEI